MNPSIYKLRFLRVQFSEKIAQHEISQFRGAVVDKIGREASVLFHNHQDGGYRYGYPLIQYKRLFGKPAIVCLADGVDEMYHLFQQPDWNLLLGERQVPMRIERLDMKQFNMGVWESQFAYHITHWLGLNEERFETYRHKEDPAEQQAMLEHILGGNIISMAKAIGWDVPQRVHCQITGDISTQMLRIKGVKKLAFSFPFRTNVFLPAYIGLGRHASFGYGTVMEGQSVAPA